MSAFDSALERGAASTDEALAIFDSLETVDTAFMLGAWRGAGFPTGHWLDGALEAYHWYGKRFESEEEVHPLVFARADHRLVTVNPFAMSPALTLVRAFPSLVSPAAGRWFQRLLPLFTSTRSGARLRMTRHRGRDSATMIYDRLPINDVFRKVDDATVLGLMDMKGMAKPFFFVLRRDRR